MNLKNFIEESDFGFWGVSITCTVASICAIVWGIKKLRKVQRVSMWGHGGTDWSWARGDAQKIALPSPGLGGLQGGASGLGGMSALGPGAGTAGLGAVGDRRAKHDYWLRKRREHIEDRQQRVQQKLAKDRAKAQASKNASSTKGEECDPKNPEGGYC